MSLSWQETVRQVEARGGRRCEYCRMHQELQGATFHVEHIIPTSEKGTDELHNLAWACPGCNLKKSNRVQLEDPVNGERVPVFNPRSHSWPDHFRWDGFTLIGDRKSVV